MKIMLFYSLLCVAVAVRANNGEESRYGNVMFFIEPGIQESASKSIGAITTELLSALEQKAGVIVAHKGLIAELVKKRKSNKELYTSKEELFDKIKSLVDAGLTLKDAIGRARYEGSYFFMVGDSEKSVFLMRFLPSEWEIYSLDLEQLFIFVPKNYLEKRGIDTSKDTVKLGLKTSSMKKVVVKEFDDLPVGGVSIDTNVLAPDFFTKILSLIFLTPAEVKGQEMLLPLWNVYMAGHGLKSIVPFEIVQQISKIESLSKKRNVLSKEYEKQRLVVEEGQSQAVSGQSGQIEKPTPVKLHKIRVQLQHTEKSLEQEKNKLPDMLENFDIQIGEMLTELEKKMKAEQIDLEVFGPGSQSELLSPGMRQKEEEQNKIVAALQEVRRIIGASSKKYNEVLGGVGRASSEGIEGVRKKYTELFIELLQGGMLRGFIAALTPEQFKSGLQFFNKIPTNLLLYSTCFGGGENLNVAYLSEGIADIYNFTIISVAQTDAPTFVGDFRTEIKFHENKLQAMSESPLDFVSFFTKASGGENFKSYADMVSDVNEPLYLPNTPLIRGRGTGWFDLAEFDKETVKITNIQAAVAQAEEKEIIIKPITKFVFLAADVVEAPVVIKGSPSIIPLDPLGRPTSQYIKEVRGDLYIQNLFQNFYPGFEHKIVARYFIDFMRAPLGIFAKKDIKEIRNVTISLNATNDLLQDLEGERNVFFKISMGGENVAPKLFVQEYKGRQAPQLREISDETIKTKYDAFFEQEKKAILERRKQVELKEVVKVITPENLKKAREKALERESEKAAIQDVASLAKRKNRASKNRVAVA